MVFRNSGGLEALADVLEFGKSDKAKDIALKAIMIQGLSKDDKMRLATGMWSFCYFMLFLINIF